MEEKNQTAPATEEPEKKPEGDVATEERATEKKPAKKSKTDELLAKIEELEKKIAEQDDKYLRMAAEYDNFRRRSREEKDATYDTAVADTVSELLPIIDNIERAAQFGEDSSVKEGLSMIAKSCEAAFAGLKIEAVGKVGETFDPNLHNAVMHDEDESRGEGEIVEVFQKGYKKGNRIIRFAMVKTVN
jgi:molecular chaperone GrpE